MEILSMKNAVKMLAMVLAAALMLTALPATQAGAEPERPVGVNRTYETIAPSPAAAVVSYNLSLKLDTQNDRLTESVKAELQNNTDAAVETLHLRFYPMGYCGYLMEVYPKTTDVNKEKKAGITGIRFDGSNQELPTEYLMDGTCIMITLGDQAMAPGEKRTLVIEAWTDIPDAENRFGIIRHEQGKTYLLSFCFPYVECSSEGMWQVDPPIYLAGEGENRNPDLKDYHVEIEVPEGFTVASAGTVTAGDGTVSIDLKEARDFAMAVSDFMDVDTFEVRGITICNYYLTAGAMDAYREISKQSITDAVEFYTDWLGEYPRKELVMVQGVAGMEHSGFFFLEGQSFLRNEPAERYNGLQRNIAHETGHAWFYDTVGNSEFREGWIDEGICSFIASDALLYNNLESYKTVGKYDPTWTAERYSKSRDSVMSMEERILKQDHDHLYLNEIWTVYPDGLEQGLKEYTYAPIFLRRAKEIMGMDAVRGFLYDVREAGDMKIIHTAEILKILRSYNDSPEMNELLMYYFDEKAE